MIFNRSKRAFKLLMNQVCVSLLSALVWEAVAFGTIHTIRSKIIQTFVEKQIVCYKYTICTYIVLFLLTVYTEVVL